MGGALNAKSTKLLNIGLCMGRFSFVQDSFLKENLGVSLQYILFLLSVFETNPPSGSLRYSIGKNIIQSTAGIVEALLHHWLEREIEDGRVTIQKAFPEESNYVFLKKLVVDCKGEEIVMCKKKKRQVSLEGEVKFLDINKALKRTSLITESQFKELEKLRKQRNKIHLKGLKEDDFVFTKKQIEETFFVVKGIITLVERKLS